MDTSNVRDAIVRIKDLPTLPSVLGKILATAADPDASALDLGQHIAADQSLSATLLKLVNSAYYGFYRQIKSVTQAIVMLGFLEVRNLALTATAFRTLGTGSSTDYDRMQLWRHSLATALAADRCAQILGLKAVGCFEAGLLHDIGRVALDMLYTEEFQEATNKAHSQGVHIIEAEAEVFGMNHAEVGGILGEHWNLPPGVVEAIRCHHAPEEAAIEPHLAQVAAVSNYITYGAELGEVGTGCPPEYPAAAVESLGLTVEQCNEIGDELQKSQEKIDEFIGALED